MSDLSARLIARRMLQLHEGLRLKPYECTAGKLTIGYGRNLDDNGISEDEANAFLDHDIDIVCIRLESQDFWHSLCAARQAVLIDMCFNLGWPRLSGFRKMLAALRVADYEMAAIQMLDSAWSKQVGNRATKLAKIMRTGEA